ncbi:MAG: hypothetical protein AABN33_13675 [Acidobacteriota bacterium]
MKRGDNLSISAELVDVRNDRQIWGEQYNRRLVDILAVQEEISREISETDGPSTSHASTIKLLLSIKRRSR